MTQHPETDDPAASSVGSQIDALCDRFEKQWKQGEKPRIEDVLNDLTDSLQPTALQELLLVEIELRLAQGDTPTISEYKQRFTGQQSVVEKVFASLSNLAAETVDHVPIGESCGLRVRCPHCHNPIELVAEAELKKIDCPSCGSSFHISGNSSTLDVEQTPRQFAHFRLTELLGMGAFGSVWKAEDTQLDRTVAVKIPRKSTLGNQEAESFLREARAAAQLKHPNIVSVYEIGREGDRVYIVSDYVAGGSLAERLESGPLTSREAAELSVKIAEALQHAHEQGVIHRDLKPANILLDNSGNPQIADFGLAKREAGEITMTMEGQVLGTPAYMSPEQAQGDAHDADARSDVYSLGVILFELLTGEMPFRGSVRMLLKQVIEDEPPSLRRLNSQVPKDLETICLKCLEKTPARRYVSAQALADDLNRFVRGEPILARPVGRLKRIYKWCRRYPAIAATLAITTVLLTLLSLSLLEQNRQKQIASKRLKASQHEVTTLNLSRASTLFSSDSGEAWRILNNFDTCPLYSREFVWRVLNRRAAGEKVSKTLNHPLPLNRVRFSKDGKWLAAAGAGKVLLWDANEHALRHSISTHGALVQSLNFSSDGSLLFMCDDEGRSGLVDCLTGKKVFDFTPGRVKTGTAANVGINGGDELSAEYRTRGEAVSLSAKNIDVEQDLKLGKLSSLEVAFVEPDKSGVTFEDLEVFCSEISSGCFFGANRLATVSQSGRLIVWQLRSYDPLHLWNRYYSTVEIGYRKTLALLGTNVQFENSLGVAQVIPSADGQAIVVIGKDGQIYQLRYDADEPVTKTLGGFDIPVTQAAIDPEGLQAFGITTEGAMQQASISVGEATLNRGLPPICKAMALASDDRIAIVTTDGGVVIQSTEENNLEQEQIEMPDGVGVSSIDFSPDGNRIACVCDDGELRIWDQETKTFAWTSGVGSAIRFVSISRRRFESSPARFVRRGESVDRTYHMVATVGDLGVAKLWRSDSGELVASFSSENVPFTQAMPLDDGKHLVTLDSMGGVTIWDVKSKTPVAKRHRHNAQRIVLGPRSKQIAVGHGTDWKVLDLSSGEWKDTAWTKALQTDAFSNGTIAFSDRSHWVAAYDFNPRSDTHLKVKVWDWSKDEEVDALKIKLQDQPRWVWNTTPSSVSYNQFAIGPYKKSFITGSTTWRDSAEQVLKPLDPTARDNYVKKFYSPSGRTLFTVSSLGRLEAWDVLTLSEKPSPLELIESKVPSVVTEAELSWDGSLLVAGGEDGTITLVDSGRSLGKVYHPKGFTPDSKYIFHDDRGSLQLLPLVPDVILRSSIDQERWGSDKWQRATRPVFSPDGEIFAQVAGRYTGEYSASSLNEMEHQEVRIFDTVTSKKVSSFRLPTIPDGEVDRAGDQDYKSLYGWLQFLSNKGNRLGFVREIGDEDSVLKVVSARGRVISESNFSEGASLSPNSYAIDADLKFACRGGSVLEIVDLGTGAITKSLDRNEFDGIDGVSLSYPEISADGRLIELSDSNKKVVVVFDIEKLGEGLAADAVVTDSAFVPAAHGDGFYPRRRGILSSDRNFWLQKDEIWRADKFGTVKFRKQFAQSSLPEQKGSASAKASLVTRSQSRPACGFSPDGRWFVVAVVERPYESEVMYRERNEHCVIHRWDLSDGRQDSMSLSLGKDFNNSSEPTPIGAMAVSVEGRLLVLYGPSRNVFRINLQNLTVSNLDPPDPTWQIRDAGLVSGEIHERLPVPQITTDSKSVGWEKHAWNINSGKHRSEENGNIHSADSKEAVLSGTRLMPPLLGFTPKAPRELTKEKKRLLKKGYAEKQAYIDVALAATHRGSSFHHEFTTPELRQYDSTTLVYRRESDGKEIMRLLFHENGEWIAVTPDGRYDCSPDGFFHWAWWDDGQLDVQIPLQALRDQFHTPNLVTRLLGGEVLPPVETPLREAIHKAAGSMALYEPITE